LIGIPRFEIVGDNVGIGIEFRDELPETWPQEAQAVVRLLPARIAAERQGKTPQNSSQPPSTAYPHAKPPSVKPKSQRSRGGQPGHDKHERALITVAECRDVVPCVPRACRRGGRKLSGRDPAPLRHQVWELPEIRPLVTEYQRHRLLCACGSSTCGDLPPGVPTGQAGPRLVAFSGLLMACFRQSKRRAAQFLSMVLNQPASAAWLVLLPNRCADAVQPAYDELAARPPGRQDTN
jgi:transposase